MSIRATVVSRQQHGSWPLCVVSVPGSVRGERERMSPAIRDRCTIGQERMPPAAKGQSPLESRHDLDPLQCNGSALTGCQAIVQQSQFSSEALFLSKQTDGDHARTRFQETGHGRRKTATQFPGGRPMLESWNGNPLKTYWVSKGRSPLAAGGASFDA